MSDRAIASMLDDHDLEALAALAPSDVAAHVVGLLDDDERRYPDVDADRWVSTGVSLFLARQHGVDLAATAWLRSRPTFARLDLVCLLLVGLWRPAGASSAVHLDALREIVAARHGVDPVPDAYVNALDQAVASTRHDADETAELARTARAAE